MKQTRPSTALHITAFVVGFFALTTVLTLAFGVSGVLRPIISSAATTVAAFVPQDSHGRTNILLLGNGDEGHAGADLTDAMIIASIDPKSRSVSLLSLPRDLFLTETDDLYASRINTLYFQYKTKHEREGITETGASLMALEDVGEAIGERIGTEIHGVFRMNFTGFVEIVDAFGGIDIDVPETIEDPFYPITEYTTGLFLIEKGPQHLDGETALKYARSRSTTSDFDRSDRQQQILKALSRKVEVRELLTNFSLISSLQEAVKDHGQWTLGTTEIFGLAGTLIGIDPDRVITMHLNYGVGNDYKDAEPGGFVYPGTYAGYTSGAILLPLSLTFEPSDWSQIQTLAHLLFTQRDLYLKKPTFSIVADRSVMLQAHRLRNELLRYGFSVPEEVQKSETPIQMPLVASLKYSSIAPVVGSLLGMETVELELLQENEIRIFLGSDYRFEPLQKRLANVQGE